jgi:hypothetical protein
MREAIRSAPKTIDSGRDTIVSGPVSIGSMTELMASTTKTAVFAAEPIGSVTEKIVSPTESVDSAAETIVFSTEWIVAAPGSTVSRLKLVASMMEAAGSYAEKAGSGRPEPAENTAWIDGRRSSSDCQSR